MTLQQECRRWRTEGDRLRYVDLYLDNNTRAPVAFDCIQIGEVAQTRTPNVKRFTMSDGTPCFYASAKDNATMTLCLECNSKNAAAIEHAVHYGSFVIAGMSYGTNRRLNPKKTAAYLPEQTGITGYLTGGVSITEISAVADLYNVSIPLQLLVGTNGEPELTDVPAVRITALYIDDKPEQLADYRYRPVGAFIRRQMIDYDFPEISVVCKSSVPDGAALLTTIERSGEVLLRGDAVLDGWLPLLPGRNDFLLTVRKADSQHYKPQHVLFTVVRDDSTDDRFVLRTIDGSVLTTGSGKLLSVKEDT